MTSSNSTRDTFNEICCCGSYTRPNYTDTMGVETLVFIFTNSVLGKGCRDSYFACATGNVISSDECAAVSVSTSKCSAYLMAAGIHFLHIYIYIYIHTHTYIYIYIHTHTRMVRFQKLTRNLFLTLHGHNLHRQQRQLSKFLMR